MTRKSHLRRTYDISEEEYDELLAHNDGRCWICGARPTKRRLHTEHDHKVKEKRKSVRGLTCWKCNTLLSKGRDDPRILRNAADYLEGNAAQEILDGTRTNP